MKVFASKEKKVKMLGFEPNRSLISVVAIHWGERYIDLTNSSGDFKSFDTLKSKNNAE